MAGHRKATGKLSRPQARAQYAARRIAEATTPGQRAAAAFDALRMAATRDAERGDAVLEEAARVLTELTWSVTPADAKGSRS